MIKIFTKKPREIILNNKTRISYKINNDKPGFKNLILLNGAIFHLQQWENFIRHGILKCTPNNYRIIRYDYLGIGYSDSKVKEWNIWDCARELNSLLETLKIQKAYFYGISQGTLVIQAFAVLYPHKVICIGGWGWFNLCYSRLIDLKPLMVRRIKMLEQMKEVWDFPLDKKIFNHLWTLLLCKSIMKKDRKQLNFAEKIYSWFVKNKMYSLIKPTPLKIIHDWFLYTITGLPLQKNKIRKKLILFKDVPVLIQHARNDEVLPIAMAVELHNLLSNSQLRIYEMEYSHVSIMFKKKQAKVVAEEFIRFIEKEKER